MTLERWESMEAQPELAKVESAISAREDDGVFIVCICSAAENIRAFQDGLRTLPDRCFEGTSQGERVFFQPQEKAAPMEPPAAKAAAAAEDDDDDATQAFRGSSDEDNSDPVEKIPAKAAMAAENEDEDDATQAFGDEDDDAGGGQPQEKAAPMEAISAVGKQYQDTAALISAISTEASGTSLRCLDGTARWHTEASAMAADTTEELEELGEK